MAISGVTGVSTGYSYGVNVSSATDPTDISIEAVEDTQIRGYEQGVKNAENGSDMLDVAEGGLEAINTALQRIRELSVQAFNGILSDSDKQSIQDEVETNLQTIKDVANGTEYNTKKLLDGSSADVNLATNPSGAGMEIKLESSTLETLGIKGYDVTGDFDISVIDEAIAKVSESRSKIGAAQSALESQVNIGNISKVNLDDNADEQLEEMINQVQEDNKKRVLEEYNNQFMMTRLKEQSVSIEKLLNL